ncbi:hydrogenase accessory protein [Rhodopseudomonas pseudopalustris]|uniref:Hydrogenase expression/formation protein n=1 Tax=Rhodopseudomonas pseudopalustris TaxID=1513892 RepID=A0A1H8NLS4_9BRAD|nr:hydrogenase accessory protein [Rhodopseudomonas pseudopalustris]SEO30516.1 hydrogenase-1 operon protein HyaE [Rhodopseudomonas pseudopalustris]
MGSPLTCAAARPDALPIIDETTVDDFITAASGKISVLFFRGDAARFPEAADIAVILPELIAAFPGRLIAAEIGAAAERALMPRFGVLVCPALALARPGRNLGAIAKIQDWSSYVARIRAMLADEVRAAQQEQPA